MPALNHRPHPSRDAGFAALVPEANGPIWPPSYRAPITVFVATSPGADRSAFAAEVLDFSPPSIALAPRDDIAEPAALTSARILFPGESVGWAFDVVLESVERLPTYRWNVRLDRGPIPVERRTASRATTHEIVLVRSSGDLLPALMLDISDTGARCSASRGARIEVGQSVEFEAADGVAPRDAEIVWWQAAGRGVDFGVRFR